LVEPGVPYSESGYFQGLPRGLAGLGLLVELASRPVGSDQTSPPQYAKVPKNLGLVGIELLAKLSLRPEDFGFQVVSRVQWLDGP
jgi:hypothetical protein